MIVDANSVVGSRGAGTVIFGAVRSAAPAGVIIDANPGLHALRGGTVILAAFGPVRA
ncbi:hypothetical protein [Nocardia stercoris]|uniref:hypothetical protein n=1 Tax=Nocardia stercoris TaxID=2483361 RepID=UPI00131A3B2A|nr:hypothetical protein [Nocardia stercoris]